MVSEIGITAGVLRRLCQVALHRDGSSLPHQDRFPPPQRPRKAPPAGRKVKISGFSPCRINVSFGRFDKGAPFAWLSGFGSARRDPRRVSDNLS
ncbi:hypothetical protein KQQSB11_300435 [Klebsiella quasipneumoniae subsp. quasipneumoniae]|nr:hypothetical protein KQQSB11_300435 [Klebsiella quasipneumoniae subsp. quasipneumoniae]